MAVLNANATEFQRRVWRATRRIPAGKVATYLAIARMIGSPGASRAVGNALNASPGMPDVPCHRVVNSDGRVGGFAWGGKKKESLLRHEGVAVAGGRVDLARFGWFG